MSFGVTDERGDDTMQGLVKRVDSALYKSKNGSRNRIEAV